jgi:hypothetical protein
VRTGLVIQKQSIERTHTRALDRREAEKPPTEGRLFADTALQNDPNAALPVATAFVFAPLEVLLLTPLPMIGIHVQAMLRPNELGSTPDMPAFALVVADNGG